MRTSITQQVQDLLQECGVPSQQCRRRKHPAVVFEVGGRRYTYTCPGSASDHRTLKNCLADVRRVVRSHGLLH